MPVILQTSAVNLVGQHVTWGVNINSVVLIEKLLVAELFEFSEH